MIVDENAYLAHYGIPRKSGRYPWGSGEDTQSARNKTFLDAVSDLKTQGLSYAAIAKAFSTDEHPFTSTQLIALKTIALNEQKQNKINMAQRLKEKGLSNIAIGERMGINESSVRSLLAPGQKAKADVLQATAEMLRRQVEEKGYIDIGTGVELDLPISSGGNFGVSKDKFQTAVAILEQEGYRKFSWVKVKQIGTGKETTIKVLAKPGAPYPKLNQIKSIAEFSKNGGETWSSIKPPLNLSSKRIAIVYDKDGGGR